MHTITSGMFQKAPVCCFKSQLASCLIIDNKLELQYIDTIKKKLEDAIQESITWLENNQEARKDEFEHKQKLLEEIANPIMMKLYGGTGRSI